MAALVGRHRGVIDEAQHELLRSAIQRPERRTRAGATINLLAELEAECVELIHESGLFNEKQSGAIPWAALFDWIVDHLPEILRVLAILLTVILEEPVNVHDST